MRKLAVVALAVLLSTGCAARINKIMQSWIGSHYSSLIASWGPPRAIYDDGSGGRVLVWTFTRSYTSPATSTTSGTANVIGDTLWVNTYTVYQPSYTTGYEAHRTFWIDQMDESTTGNGKDSKHPRELYDFAMLGETARRRSRGR